MKNFYPIQIRPANNGIIVTAGCLKIVYQQNQLSSFLADLEFYLKEPGLAYKAIRERWGIEEEDRAEEAPTTRREEGAKEAEAERTY